MSSITRAQRWVMAVPWHAVMVLKAPWDHFGLVRRPIGLTDVVNVLAHDWNIRTKQDAERTLASLSASANVRDAAWHLSNAIVVAELAFAAYLIDADRAWSAAVDAARQLQRHHRGWFSMAEGYLRGMAVHRPDASDSAARDFLISVFARPDSPWNVLAWNTELPEHIPPPLPSERVIDVYDGESLDAATAGNPGARIRLASGTYVGPFLVNGHTLECADLAPIGTVIIEAGTGIPITTINGGCLRGLIVRGAETAAVVVECDFARIEDCHFEGGTIGVAAKSGACVQLASVVFEGLADTAVTLADSVCCADKISISEVAVGFMLEGSQLLLEDSLIESADRAGIIANGGALVLRKLRVHDAERWGVALSGGARAILDDVEIMRSLVGLRAADAATIRCERSRFADCGTANIELLDVGGARFVDCHVTGGEWAGVWLHPGNGTSFRGGQVGGSRQACVMVEGGRDVALSGVGIGPSHEGGGLFIAGAASVEAEQVFVTGAAMAGVELRASTLTASDLRVRGSLEGVLVRDAGRFDGYRIDLAELRGSGLWLAGGSASVAGLGLRKVRFGVVVGSDAVALVQNFVCANTPVVAQVEGGRLALAGRLTLGGGSVRIKSGQFAARGLEGTPVIASDVDMYLENASAMAPGMLEVNGHSRVFLAKCALTDAALVTASETRIICDPALPPITATSPMSLGLVPERFATWGVIADPALLLRIVEIIAWRVGVLDKITLRETPEGVRIDGPFAAIARVVPAVSRLYDEAGALGVVLADLVSPRAPPRAPPTSLA